MKALRFSLDAPRAAVVVAAIFVIGSFFERPVLPAPCPAAASGGTPDALDATARASAPLDPNKLVAVPVLPLMFVDRAVVDGNAVALGSATTSHVRAAHDADVQFEGWAFDARAKKPARALYARIDGGPWMPARYGSARPDIARIYSDDGLVPSGFSLRLHAPHAAGSHRVDLAIATADGKGAYFVRDRLRLDVAP